jgi:hypothetical protein
MIAKQTGKSHFCLGQKWVHPKKNALHERKKTSQHDDCTTTQITNNLWIKVLAIEGF